MKIFLKIAIGILMIVVGFILIFLGIYYRMAFPTYAKVLGFTLVVVGYFLILFTVLSKR